MKIPVKLFSSIWFWSLVVLFVSALFWYLSGIRPELMSFTIDGFNEESNLVTADTYTYWFHASETPWFSVPINLIGPVSLIKLLDLNFDLAVLLIVLLFCLALRELYRYAGVRVLPFAVLFLANPSMTGQFFAINKEILIIISLLFVVIYVHSGRTKHIIAAIAIAVFSKPEFLVLIMFFLVSRGLRSGRRPFILLAMITMISLFYSDLPNMDSYAEVLLRGQTAESLGITVLLQELAAQYHLYFIVVVPRLLLTIYSGGVLFASIFILALMPVILKKKLQLADDIVFLLCLYLIMVSIVPFPHYRYILPIYPLLLFLALRPKKAIYISSYIRHRNI
ncbi:MAG: hypothetical protein H7240_09545 [Glaciimonas sp.]|nr:hypothetical protein [Glaciimonas sp.]